MPLYLYPHRPETVLVTPDILEWTKWYVDEAYKDEPPSPGQRRWKQNHILYKLGCFCFAHRYGLEDQWDERHTRVTKWNTDVDFVINNWHIRIVATACNEKRKEQFGAHLAGRVWAKQVERNPDDVFVLSAFYLPYMDFVGWVTRAELMKSEAPKGFSLYASMTQSMEEMWKYVQTETTPKARRRRKQ